MERKDKRKEGDIRKLKIQLGLCNQADGSAYVHQGSTKVLALVYGPHEVRSGKDYKAVNTGALVYTQFNRTISYRSEAKQGFDEKAAQMMRQTFESSIITSLYPRTQIDIFIQVLQSDGSDVSASINAASLALVDAGIQMKGLVCGCSCKQVNGVRLIDLTWEEERMSNDDNEVYALLPFTNQLVMLNSSGNCFTKNENKDPKNAEVKDHLASVKDACKSILLYLHDAIKKQHANSNKTSKCLHN